MGLFKPAVSSSAYLKAGLLGFAGAGKSRTATEIAMGMVGMMREMGLREAERPIMFFDTETGSDYLLGRIQGAGMKLETVKSRSFVDLKEGTKEAAERGAFLIIDSVTHVWREFCAAYKKKKNRTKLEFQDWDTLKQEWNVFTELYINVPAHIALCGRAGYEYDMEANEETGKKELQKTGVKMKAEGEMGYEPSLLILMESEMNMRTKVQYRVAHVLKDRFGVLDGKELCDENTFGPTFEMFVPHIKLLTLGGTHMGVDASRNSAELFAHDGTTRWKHEQQQKAICLDEVKEEINRMIPGQGAADKTEKANALEHAFGTRSWAKVESLGLDQLKVGRDRIWMMSRDHRYGQEPGPADDSGGWVAGDAPADQQAQQKPTGIELEETEDLAPAATDPVASKPAGRRSRRRLSVVAPAQVADLAESLRASLTTQPQGEGK